MNVTERSQMLGLIEECLTIGPMASIAKSETARGFIVRHPGDETFFPLEDWDNSIISIDCRRVRILMVRSRTPGAGAFSRMINAILLTNMIPVVVAPLEPLKFILHNWRWHKSFSPGNFFEREEIWVPTKQWKKERLKCLV